MRKGPWETQGPRVPSGPGPASFLPSSQSLHPTVGRTEQGLEWGQKLTLWGLCTHSF